MKKYVLKYGLITLISIFPMVSLAAPLDGVKGFLIAFKGLLNLAVPVVIGLALIYFLWGTAQFILHAGEQKSRDEGKQKMLWGIIALFVMFSIWGILSWIGTTIGIPIGGGSGAPSGTVVPCWQNPSQNGCQTNNG